MPLLLLLALAALAPAQQKPSARLGINLSGPADYNTERPFADAFRMARSWISQRNGAAWGKGPALDLDKHGWVKKLELECTAVTAVLTGAGTYPAGRYTVLYDGQGTMAPAAVSRARVSGREPGKLVLDVDNSAESLMLELREVNPANYVRNIRVILPGMLDSYQTNPFTPDFLARWKGVAAIRFMDWFQTNGSETATWDDRPTLDDAATLNRGIPAELCIDLANRLHAAPWINIPHRADDTYVRNLARLVHDRLDPSLPVYLEYSNEVWNSGFAQNRYAGERGIALGFAAPDKPWEGAWLYTAFRSLQIFDIWAEVFGGGKRLVRVLPSQAVNTFASREILNFRDAYRHADALAIAPYMGFIVTPTSKPSAAEVARWTLDQLFAHLESVALPEAEAAIAEQKKVADQSGLKLVAYEGGQHLIGAQGAENNQALTELLLAANADPRMGSLYRRYLDSWTRLGGGLFCHFSSVASWSKWGSWGLLQAYNDDPNKAPKFRAVKEWAASLGQPMASASNSETRKPRPR